MTEYNIVLNSNSDKDTIVEFLKTKNIHIKQIFSNLPIIVIISDINIIEDIKNNALIKSIEKTRKLQITTSNPLSTTYNNINVYNWGRDRLDQRIPYLNKKFSSLKTGKNVNIFIVDTGILLTHNEIKDRIDPSNIWDSFRDPLDPFYGFPDIELINGNVDDHGTHVSSLAVGKNVGIAHEANLIPVRVFNNNGFAEMFNFLQAIDWIIDKHQSIGLPSIVNMSFSSKGKYQDIEAIIKTLVDAGIIVVVSAGNNSDDSFYYSPSGEGSKRNIVNNKIEYSYEYFKPIVIGATTHSIISPDLTELPADFSNYGETVDFWVPGSYITGASFKKIDNTSDFSDNTVYGIKSGTSMAAPLLSGIIALYLEDNPTLSHQEIRNILHEHSTKGIFPYTSLSNKRNIEDFQGVDISTIENIYQNNINEMPYIWFQETFLEWNSKDIDFVIEQVENTTQYYKFRAISLNVNGEQERLLFGIEEINDPIPNWIVISQEYVETQRIGNISFGDTNGILRIISPDVTSDIIIPPFNITVSDGRKIIKKEVNITIKNVYKPPIWSLPESGNLGTINNNDVIAIPLIAYDIDGSNISYQLLSSITSLPNGIRIENDMISGIVNEYELNNKTFEFLIRATNQAGLISDRYFSFNYEPENINFSFNQEWLSSLQIVEYESETFYKLSTKYLNDIVNIPIIIDNPMNSTLNLSINNLNLLEDTNNFNGLPVNLNINSNNISGNILENTNLGNYYFEIFINDGINSITEKFIIEILETNNVNPALDSEIYWITPSGSLGHTYETYPSHFQIKASNPSNQLITFFLDSTSQPLPEGLTLNQISGEIIGRCPFLENDTTFEIKVRAYVGSTYSLRVFSFTVRKLYESNQIMNIKIHFTGRSRQELLRWLWYIDRIPDENIFRANDDNYGRQKYPSMYLISGLKKVSSNIILEQLRDYHHTLNLRLHKLEYAKGIDPSGNHIYDIVYFSVIDPLKNAGGFKNNAENIISINYGKLPEIKEWNLPANSTQYFPNSIENIRYDLINTTNRIDWKVEENIVESSTNRGIGLSLKEGFPFWMTSIQDSGEILGFVPGLILAYVQPNLGKSTIATLELLGFLDEFSGKSFKVDRYVISNLEYDITTHFDNELVYRWTELPNDLVGSPIIETFRWSTGSETTFDGIPITSNLTQFDPELIEMGKYFKFPPGDQK